MTSANFTHRLNGKVVSQSEGYFVLKNLDKRHEKSRPPFK